METALFTITTLEDAALLHCAGELDLAARSDLSARISDLLDGAAPHVVVDLTDVVFIDCSAVGAFLTLGRALRPSRRLSVVCPPGRVRRVLAMTAFDRAHRVAPTLADTLALARAS
jgi:anti-sigma B factor antagonist